MRFPRRHVRVGELGGLARIRLEEIEELLVVRDGNFVLVDPERGKIHFLPVLVDEFAGRNLDQSRFHTALPAGKKTEKGKEGDDEEEKRHARRDEQSFFLLLFRLLDALFRRLGPRGDLPRVLRSGRGLGRRNHSRNTRPSGIAAEQGLGHARGHTARRSKGRHCFGKLFHLRGLVRCRGGGRRNIDHARTQRLVEDEIGRRHGPPRETVLGEMRGHIRRGAQSREQGAIFHDVPRLPVSLERIARQVVGRVEKPAVRLPGLMHGEQIRMGNGCFGPGIGDEGFHRPGTGGAFPAEHVQNGVARHGALPSEEFIDVAGTAEMLLDNEATDAMPHQRRRIDLPRAQSGGQAGRIGWLAQHYGTAETGGVIRQIVCAEKNRPHGGKFRGERLPQRETVHRFHDDIRDEDIGTAGP